jgi:hypothetical protein
MNLRMAVITLKRNYPLEENNTYFKQALDIAITLLEERILEEKYEQLLDHLEEDLNNSQSHI